jgi:hypothetical protein
VQAAADGPPVEKDTEMLSFELDHEPRRLEDFDIEQLEAFIQRGRTLQARAMGRGLKALFRSLFFGTEPAGARTERGTLDWDKVLGLAPQECHSARGAWR